MIANKPKLEHKGSIPVQSNRPSPYPESTKNPRTNQKSVLNESPNPKKNNNKNNVPSVAEHNNSHLSRCNSNSNVSKQLMDSFARSDKSIKLHERLKNLHLFYKNKIDEEKSQTTQRNNVFLGIIEQMQASHQEKVASLRKMIEEAENEKRDVGLVDERMNDIKGSIEEILKQSAELKTSNDRLERQIHEKQISLRDKEEELGRIKEEITEARNQLQGFERLNLKEKKRNREIITLIDKTVVQHG